MAKTFKKILKPSEKKKKKKEVAISAVKQLVQYLETHCIELEGICRISGNSIQVKELKKQLENGEDADFSKMDPHVVSGALKSFLRDNDEPLLTFDLYKNFLASIDVRERNAKISFIKSLLSALPKENYDLLQILLKFLYTIQLHSNKNKMTSSNLAIVFSPTLLRPKEESLETMMTDSNTISEIVKILIDEFNALYEIKTQTILYQVSAQEMGIEKDKRSTSEQLEDAKVSIEQLTKHLAEEARERSILETYVSSIEQKIAELQDLNKSLTEEKESLGELLNEFKDTNKYQSSEIENLKEKQSKTENESNSSSSPPLSSSSSLLLPIIFISPIRNLSPLNNFVVCQNELYNNKVNLEKNIENFKLNIDKLNSDVKNQSIEIEKLKQLNKEKELENDRLRVLNKEKDADNERLRQLNKEKDINHEQLKQQLTKEKDEAVGEVARVQAEISLLLSATNDKSSKKNSLKIQKKDLDQALKKCKDQETKISQLEKEKSKLSDEITKLQKQASTPAPSSSTHKFVLGKKPSQKQQPAPPPQTPAPPPLDEDDIISVKKFAFYYMSLYIKTDHMVRGLPCNISSYDILDELIEKKVKVNQWSEFISRKLKEIS
ncbi:hypothetical protein DICPUDRAFT_158397 [Dictyostelium purpureum]|uniref:Rho-GAP domain-containing protein n=1 Tax=Dictyostelium purpureum TaxID=5786 RepID=F1A1I8_DICPU|nr:uncharacterized protein DICPUDRAFT_158397 [Dictyostelium purpureum]EGC29951.1 hypothetical protein DICPUDRAFT_158397 [Dictyostelium purpureum]|eukprot:XP_003293532.1 hypothetical protein DICPUDRAFT_158397 [Dictyostelium purpureum]